MTARTLRLRKAIRGGRQEAAQATSPVGGRARSRTGCLRVMSPAWSRFTHLLGSGYRSRRLGARLGVGFQPFPAGGVRQKGDAPFVDPRLVVTLVAPDPRP